MSPFLGPLCIAVCISYAAAQVKGEHALNATEPGRHAKAVRTDRYGDPLPDGAVARFGTSRFRHGGSVVALGFSRDGKRVLSAGEDGVRLWEVSTGRELGEVAAPNGAARLRALAPRSGTAVTWSPDGGIRVWDVAAGRILRRFRTDEFGPTHVALSPDGRWLVRADNGPGIALWDVRSGRKVGDLIGHPDDGAHLEFSSCGRRVLAWSRGNKTASVWDVATRVRTRQYAFGPPPMAVSWAPDDQTLIVIGWDAAVRLWDIVTGKERPGLPKQQLADAAVLSPDGTMLAFASSSGEHGVELWDMGRRRRLRHLAGSAGLATGCLAFSPDARLLATGGADHAIHIWDVGTGQRLDADSPHRGAITEAFFLVDDVALLTGGQDDRLGLWDTATGVLRRYRSWRKGGCRAVALDGQTVAWVAEDGRIYITGRRGCRQIRVAGIEGGTVDGVAFSPNAGMLASTIETAPTGDRASFEHRLDVWNATTGNKIATLGKYTGWEHRLQFSGDGRWLAVAFSVGGACLELWDTHTWTKKDLSPSGVDNRLQNVIIAFSRDGRLLATAIDHRESIELWEVCTGKCVGQLGTPSGVGVRSLAFNPRGWFVAAGSDEGAIVLLDVTNGKVRRRQVGHRGPVRAVGFSHEHNFLISASDDATALVWDVSSWVSDARQPHARFTRSELNARWVDLAGADAGAARRAIWSLTRSPDEAVAFLARYLQPLTAAESLRIPRLLLELGSERFITRQRATRELERLEMLARPALRSFLTGKPPPEARRRAEQLLTRLESVPSGSLVRSLRAVEVLERIGTEPALRLLDALARGDQAAQLTQEANEALARMHKTQTPGR